MRTTVIPVKNKKTFSYALQNIQTLDVAKPWIEPEPHIARQPDITIALWVATSFKYKTYNYSDTIYYIGSN